MGADRRRRSGRVHALHPRRLARPSAGAGDGRERGLTMPTIHVNDEADVRFIALSLRVAAEVYTKDAETSEKEGTERVAAQFRRQAEKALRMAEAIEDV